MADMCDNMDEFFDFAQLERDSASYGGLFSAEHDEALAGRDVLTMDWQPTLPEAAETHSLGTNLLYNQGTLGVVPGCSAGPTIQQWSLAEMLDQPLCLTDSNTVLPNWPHSHVLATTGSHQHHAPSSSIQTHDSTRLTGGDSAQYVCT